MNSNEKVNKLYINVHLHVYSGTSIDKGTLQINGHHRGFLPTKDTFQCTKFTSGYKCRFQSSETAYYKFLM